MYQMDSVFLSARNPEHIPCPDFDTYMYIDVVGITKESTFLAKVIEVDKRTCEIVRY